MTSRSMIPGALTASLLVAASAAIVLARETEDLAELESERTPSYVATGTVTSAPDGLGHDEYFLMLEDGSTPELSAGPPWFWGDAHPLSSYLGMSVEVAGHLSEESPAASGRSEFMELEVLSIDGTQIVEPGAPPWAGAPAWAGPPWVAGEAHPGFEGWSRGQANVDRVPGPPGSVLPQTEGGQENG